MNILKRSRVNSIIGVWSEYEINNEYSRRSENRDAEILQVAYVCENKYIVEFVRKPKDINKEELKNYFKDYKEE